MVGGLGNFYKRILCVGNRKIPRRKIAGVALLDKRRTQKSQILSMVCQLLKHMGRRVSLVRQTAIVNDISQEHASFYLQLCSPSFARPAHGKKVGRHLRQNYCDRHNRHASQNGVPDEPAFAGPLPDFYREQVNQRDW